MKNIFYTIASIIILALAGFTLFGPRDSQCEGFQFGVQIIKTEDSDSSILCLGILRPLIDRLKE